MHRQTVEQVMSLLVMVQQPAFCIRKNGSMAYNEAASTLRPSCAMDLPQWLGNAKAQYNMWDRTEHLQLLVRCNDTDFSVTVQPLADGTLFLMTPCQIPQEAANAMMVASQVMRLPLSNLSMLLQSAQNTNRYDEAALSRQVHRLTRIAGNLSEISRLTADHPHMTVKAISANQIVSELLELAAPPCSCMNRQLSYVPSGKNCTVYADKTLLLRALLNLLSNALKFSPADSTVTIRTEVIGNHLMFRIENACTDKNSNLLQVAFNRLTDRGFVPDPSWGVGLGLPLACAIARHHGGMVAVERTEERVCVSLSVSLQEQEETALGTMSIDYTGGMNQALLELSDALPTEAYR